MTNHKAPTFHSQLVLPEYFDPLLKHFVFFQEPDKTKNMQSNEKSVTLTRNENFAKLFEQNTSNNLRRSAFPLWCIF